MSDQGLLSLSYAARPRVVLRLFGQLAGVLSLLFLVPGVVAVFSGEWSMLRAVAISAVPPALAWVALRRLPVPRDLQHNEALVVLALTFLVAALLGSIPLSASGIGWLDAFFESTSGITTTGLSTLPSVEGRSATFLFTRAWLQWCGGLGIVVLGVALVLGPGVVARRLETVGTEPEDLIGSARENARIILRIYLALTAVVFALLCVTGVAPFDALLYTLAAVSTGGFAPHDASLAALGGWLQPSLVILGCLAGSVTLVLYQRARRGGPAALLRDVELQALLALGVASSLLIFGFSAHAAGGAGLGPVRSALLAFSAQTTAGFSPVSIGPVDDASKLVLITSMAIGASTGSTAGGFKLMRLLVVIQVTRWALARVHLPRRAVAPMRLGGTRLGDGDIRRAVALLGLFTAAAAVSWLVFLVYGLPALDSLFDVASALGTVGLSTGVTGPGLPPALKLLLCADMLFGRLEVLALLVLVSPRTWLGRRRG